MPIAADLPPGARCTDTCASAGLTRRRVIQWLPFASVGAGLSAHASASSYPHLDELEARAREVGYVEDASRVDRHRYLKYRVGETCGQCDLYLATATEPWAGCTLFPRRWVAGGGWCDAYRPRSADVPRR